MQQMISVFLALAVAAWSWLNANALLTQAECPPSYPYTFMDDTGASITLTDQPANVAVLTSSLADLWLVAGGTVNITVGESIQRELVEDHVLLVDQGAGKTINMEILLAAEPDLVLYSAELAGQRNCAPILAATGIPAAGYSLDDFEDYLRLLNCFTEILGTPERYQQYGMDVEGKIERIIASVHDHTNPPTYLFVRAGSSANVTKAKTSRNHFVCRMLEDIGAVNIAEGSPQLLDDLSMEAVLAADPDYILYSVMGSGEDGMSYMDQLLDDPVWKSLSAVRQGRVYHLSKDLYQYKPNARWAEAYHRLVDLLYGEKP